MARPKSIGPASASPVEIIKPAVNKATRHLFAYLKDVLARIKRFIILGLFQKSGINSMNNCRFIGSNN